MSELAVSYLEKNSHRREHEEAYAPGSPIYSTGEGIGEHTDFEELKELMSLKTRAYY
jgi:hypothetical protein